MRKIPTIFKRNFGGTIADRQFVLNEINPEAQWVFDGEGVATRKYDGTACAIIDGEFWKRYEVMRGKTPPPGFKPANKVDPNTGKQQGWMPVENDSNDKYLMEAYGKLQDKSDGTFELVGPKVQKNPEGYSEHILIRHSEAEQYPDAPRTFEGIKDWLRDKKIEGLVWHHSDGRMAKIKRRDFKF